MSLAQFPGSNLFFFADQAALAVRTAEVPNAAWTNGANNAGLAPGIGIGQSGSLVDSKRQDWTLLDQFEVARTPQVSQAVGGNGLGAGIPGNGSGHGEFVIQGDNSDEGTGEIISSDGAANLNTLAAGWVAG